MKILKIIFTLKTPPFIMKKYRKISSILKLLNKKKKLEKSKKDYNLLVESFTKKIYSQL